MYGGKVVWMIDPVFASMDSLRTSDVTMAIPQDLNLDDQLFTYGVRVNANLIQDLQSAPIPIVTEWLSNTLFWLVVVDTAAPLAPWPGLAAP